jgi:hypothetical protein
MDLSPLKRRTSKEAHERQKQWHRDRYKDQTPEELAVTRRFSREESAKRRAKYPEKMSEYQRVYRVANPEKYKQAQKKYKQKIDDFVKSIKKSPCVDCGGSFPRECMDFDHVPGRGEKSFNISRATADGVSIKKIMTEISKCDLVCANCHRIRTASRGWRSNHG